MAERGRERGIRKFLRSPCFKIYVSCNDDFIFVDIADIISAVMPYIKIPKYCFKLAYMLEAFLSETVTPGISRIEQSNFH